MEETLSLKRQRVEEAQINENEEVFKRQKSYKDIITLLEEEEDEPDQDLSSFMSTLQEELSSGAWSDNISSDSSMSGTAHFHSGPAQSVSYSRYETDPENPSTAGSSGSEEEEGERVMRHLLEASDDELGIPNTATDSFDAVVGGQVDGGDLFLPVGEGLWEFEDHEAANYYSLLQ